MNFDIKNIVFDFDGVLSDMNKKSFTKDFYPKDYKNCFHFALGFLTKSGFRKEFLNSFNALKLGEKDINDICLMFEVIYPNKSQTVKKAYNNLIESIQIREMMISLSDYLRQNGIKTFILSNTHPATAKIIKQPEIAGHFDGIYCSSDYHNAKPNVETFTQACSLWGINPSESMFIDDKTVNINGAKSAGFAKGFTVNNESEIRQKIFDNISEEGWEYQKS